jgi:hypothetical protein
MTVTWKQTALDDRTRFLDNALEHAIAIANPQIYVAAARHDDQMEMEGNNLDGVATYAEGPISETRLYPCKNGKYVLVYTRTGDRVEILWVAPTRSNWKPLA